MSAHDIKLFGDAVAATRLETRFGKVKAKSLLRLAIEDLYPERIALVSSFGADAAVLLHMISEVDKTTPVVFVDTGQHFPETLAYRDELCGLLGLTNLINAARGLGDHAGGRQLVARHHRPQRQHLDGEPDDLRGEVEDDPGDVL